MKGLFSQEKVWNSNRLESSSSVILNKEFKVTACDEEWLNLFDLRLDRVIAQPFFKIFPQYFNENWIDSFSYAAEGLTNIKIVDRTLINTQNSKKLVWTINPQKDPYKNIIGLVLSVGIMDKNDSFDLKKKKNKESISLLSQAALNTSWEYNLKRKEWYWSRDLKEILGVEENYSPNLSEGLRFMPLKSQQRLFESLLHRAITLGQDWENVFKIKPKKGPNQNMISIGRPKFTNGLCERIIGEFHLITDKETEIKTPKFETFKWQNMEYLPTSVALINLVSGTIEKVNLELCHLLGVDRKQLENQSFESFVCFNAEEKKQWLHSIKTNKGFRGIEKKIQIDDYSYPILVNGKTISEKGNKWLLVTLERNPKSKNENSLISHLKNQDEINQLLQFAGYTTMNLNGKSAHMALNLNLLSQERNPEEISKYLCILKQSNKDLWEEIQGIQELISLHENLNKKTAKIQLSVVVDKINALRKKELSVESTKIHNEIPDDSYYKGNPAIIYNVINNVLKHCQYDLKDKTNSIIFVSEEKTKNEYVIIVDDNSSVGIDNKGDNSGFGDYIFQENQKYTNRPNFFLAKFQIEKIGGRIELNDAQRSGNHIRICFPML